MDQFYFEEGYLEAGYFSVVREAVASLSASFSSSVDGAIADTTGYYIPDYIEEGYYALPVQEADALVAASATLAISATNIKQLNSSINSEFTETAVAGRIQQGAADLGALFTPSIIAVASKNILAVIDSTTDLTATISKFTGFESTLENIVNLSLQGDRIRSADSALSSSFVQNADAARFRNLQSNLAVSFELTIVTGTKQDGAAQFNSEFSQTFAGGLLQTAASTQSSAFVQTATAITFIPKTLPYSRPNDLQEYLHLGPGNDWIVNTGTSFVSYTSVSNYFGLDGYIATIDQSIPSGADDASALVAALPTLTIDENDDFYIEIFYDPNFNGDNFAGETTILSLGQNINSPSYISSNFSTINMDGAINIGYSSPNSITGETLRAEILKSDGTTLTLTVGTNIFGATRIVLRRIGSTITLWSSVTGSTSATYSGRISGINSIDTLGIYDAVALSGTSTDDPDIGRVVFKLGDGGPSSITSTSDLDSVYNDENTVAYYEFNQNLNDTTTLILESNANLTSAFTITANPGATLDATVLQVSAGTLSASANVTRSTDATLSSQSTVTADAIKPVDFAASLSSAFTQSTTATITAVGSSIVNANATVSATATRIKSFDTTFTSIASQLTAITRIGQGFITSEIATQLTASGDKTTGYSATLAANSTISSVILRLRSLSAQLASSSTILATANRLGDLRAIFEAASTVDTVAQATKSAASTATATVELNSTVQIAIKASGADLVVESTVAATPSVTRTDSATLDSQFTQITDVIKAVDAEASLDSVITLDVDNDRIRNVRIGYAGDRIAKTISTYGNVEISTAQSKFGSGSALITDTGDYFTVPGDSSLYNGDFTVEMWLYASNLTSIPNGNIWDNRTSSTSGMYMYVSYGSIGLGEGINIKGLTSAGFNNNQWNHIALVRNGTNAKVFVNGVQKISATVTTTNYSNRTTYIGSTYTGSTPMRSYFDEVRLSSSARYTTGFTPSTTAFTSDGDVRALLHLDTDFSDDVGYAPGLEAFVSTLTAVAKVGDSLITLNSAFTQIAEGIVYAGSLINVDSAFTQETINDRIRSDSVDLTSAFTQSFQSIISVKAEANLDTSIEVSAVAVKIVDAEIAISGAMTFVAIAKGNLAGEIDIESSATLAIDAIVTREAVVDLYTQATITAQQTSIKNASAAFNFAVTANATGRIIAVEAIVYTIPRETRTYTVERESRIYTIHTETRAYTIQGD